MSRSKRCSGCGRVLPVVEYHRKGDAVHSKCKECSRVQFKKNPSRQCSLFECGPPDGDEPQSRPADLRVMVKYIHEHGSPYWSRIEVWHAMDDEPLRVFGPWSPDCENRRRAVTYANGVAEGLSHAIDVAVRYGNLAERFLLLQCGVDVANVYLDHKVEL